MHTDSQVDWEKHDEDMKIEKNLRKKTSLKTYNQSPCILVGLLFCSTNPITFTAKKNDFIGKKESRCQLCFCFLY